MQDAHVRPENGSQGGQRAQGRNPGKAGHCPMSEFHLPASYHSHPGGQHMLKIGRESDVPGLLFLSYHMGRDLDGKVTAACRALGVEMPERGELYDEIHEAVRRVIADNMLQGVIFRAWCLVQTLCLPVAFVCWLVQPSLVMSVICAMLFECYFLNIFHTRHHKGGHLYENPMLDVLTAPIYEFIDCTWGYVPEAWFVNHHVRHHLHTNDTDMDPDLPETHPMVRVSADQPRFWYNKFQTFYWPLLLPFSVMRFPLQNLLKYGGGPTMFITWFILMFGCPFLFHGLDGLVGSLVVQGLTGCLITTKFAVSHCHCNLGNGATGHVKTLGGVDDWLMMQVEESMSWGGYLSCLVWGGIGFQIEHHLCPSIYPTYYPFIQKDLQRICHKHGIRYTSEPTILHAMKEFHMQLWRMG